jgi:hypothetical protein
VGKAQFVEKFEVGAATTSECGGGPFADAVESEDGGFVEGRRKKCARGMSLVVCGEVNGDAGVAESGEFVGDGGAEPEFFLQP